MRKKDVKEAPVKTEEEVMVEAEEAMTTEETKVGIVTDCMNLNVRKAPDSDADIICQIPCLSEILIDEAGSTEDFYKVCTAAGVEGFCMKRFIRIRK